MSKPVTFAARAAVKDRTAEIERTIEEFRETILCHHDERVRWLIANTEIRVNGRLTVTGGRAYHYHRTMEVSGALFKCPINTLDDLWDTLAHEFAHIVEFDTVEDKGHLRRRTNAEAHNETWRAWAIEFGDRDAGKYHDLFIPKDYGRAAERAPYVLRWCAAANGQAEVEARLARVNSWRALNGLHPLK